MSRKISSRLTVTGILHACTPIHVGGFGFDVDTDMPLARNGRGDFYIPGTSIAGVLRAWCERNFSRDDIWNLFGPERKQGSDDGHASFILIEDATLLNSEQFLSEIRDGVGIDRISGTAADRSKFDRAIMPRATELDFKMTVEFAENEPLMKAIIGHILDALGAGKIRFGASKTRGFGSVRLENKAIVENRFDSFEGVMSIFKVKEKPEILKDRERIESEMSTFKKQYSLRSIVAELGIEIDWSPVLPVMNKVGYEGVGVDMLPLTTGTENGQLSLVLAGSAVKGAIRSHAERIMRTLLNRPATGKFNDHIKGIPFVEEIFGSKKEKDNSNPKLGRGALSIDDCYSKGSFSRNNWQNVVQGRAVETESSSAWEITQGLNAVQTELAGTPDAGSPKMEISHHTAIDRFTGGVADGALYSVLMPHGIQWNKLRMNLDFARTQNPKKCLMLVLLVLRDLVENRIPLGFATNRGMGEISVNEIKLTGTMMEKLGLMGDIWIKIENGRFAVSETLAGLAGPNGKEWWI